MRALPLTLIALSLFVFSPTYAQQPNPNEVRDQLTGDAQGPAANNPQCKLFTTGEIGKYLGMAVGAGENAAGGSGCLWAGKDEESTVLVQVVAPRYYTEPSLVAGFKRLSNIGTKAWASYAQTMLSLGYYDEAQQATTWAEAYSDLAHDAIGQYAACL